MIVLDPKSENVVFLMFYDKKITFYFISDQILNF